MNEPYPSSPSQIDRAIAKYELLVIESPQKAEFHANLGSCYAQQQQWQKAISCYERAIALEPNLAGVYRNLAKIYSKIDNELKAANYLFEGLKLEPFWADAREHYHLGNLLQSQNKPAKAEFCYRQAIELKPDYFPAYHSLGELLASQEKISAAIAVYRQGIKHNPDNARLHFALGQISAAEEKWERANDCYQKAVELEPTFALGYYQWAIVLFRINRWLQALECCRKAIHLQPNYWEAYYQLGVILQNQQQWSEAVLAYQKVKELAPNFVPAIIRSALLYRNLQQYGSAIECYQQAIDLSIPDSDLEEEALLGYEETIKYHPQPQASLYYQLGRVFRAKSLFPKAIAAYQKAIELDPTFVLAYIDLQYTQIAAESLDSLIEFYRQIIRQHPEVSLAWGNLGDALTKKKQIPEAIDCYVKSCYQRTVSLYPQLAELDWQNKKRQAPDFIIIGAEKCGTSSLHNYLSYHPQVLLPHKKEINFFNKNFDLGIDWYFSQFPSITDAPNFITGESTPNYLRFPLAARRIKEYCPTSKLILLLRNPIERAVSWHYHKVNTGLETGNFVDAMNVEIEKLKSFSDRDFEKTSYRKPDNILSSLYIYKIKAWLELFDRKSFLIIKSEDLYENPRKVMSEVFGFLGLEEYQLEEYPKVNAGSYSEIDEETRRTLAAYFQPHNQKLEDYLNVEFDWK